MSWIKKIGMRLRKNVKYSASDPRNFEEIWSFQSNAIRLISLILILFVGIGFLAVWLFSSGGIVGYAGNASIERSKLEEQKLQIEELTAKVQTQEDYIENIRLIFSGEVPLQIESDSIVGNPNINLDSIKTDLTQAENQLSREVKNDLSTPVSSESSLTYFGSPVRGVISQKFDRKKHPGIDVVTSKGTTVKACLGGTVLYAGYSRKDGYILIVGHPDGFVSVYKHNKTLLKKTGAKVQLGDPVAIVGNSGQNTDGPHLHFELWYKLTPVNPTDYIRFTK